MVGSTGKRYGEEFKLMILEMHKKGKTISNSTIQKIENDTNFIFSTLKWYKI